VGDAGEGLIDAEARIQERLDDVARERSERLAVPIDPDTTQARESLRLARAELERQLAADLPERRRVQLADAVAEIDRRMQALG
jgi:hypothetical protein